MDVLPYLFSVLGSGALTAVLIQFRLWRRDKRELDLARHMFDQTRSTDAMQGYARLIEARRGRGSHPPPALPAADEPKQAELES